MDSGKSASVHGETKNNQYGAGNAFSKIIRNPERGPIPAVPPSRPRWRRAARMKRAGGEPQQGARCHPHVGGVRPRQCAGERAGSGEGGGAQLCAPRPRSRCFPLFRSGPLGLARSRSLSLALAPSRSGSLALARARALSNSSLSPTLAYCACAQICRRRPRRRTAMAPTLKTEMVMRHLRAPRPSATITRTQVCARREPAGGFRGPASPLAADAVKWVWRRDLNAECCACSRVQVIC